MAKRTAPSGDPRHGDDPLHDDKGTAGPSIVWFRADLRVGDHPALDAARRRGVPMLCIFILEQDKGLRPLGAASRWWLHHSLDALGKDLRKAGAELALFAGAARDIVPALIATSGAGALFFNRRNGASGRKLDDSITQPADAKGCAVETFNGRLLFEPWEIETKAGGSYGVYTPYANAVRARGLPGHVLPRPRKLKGATCPRAPKPSTLTDLDLLPTKPDWAKGWRKTWTPGEAGAGKRVRDFLDNDLAAYPEERDRLASRGTSRLSPHLRFGEISPRQIVAAVREAETKANSKGTIKFLSEVLWREFDYHVMFHHPDVATKNLHANFDKMPWRKVSAPALKAWQRGRTGFPVVDAGMRELWQTGTMHNRVRMITASFLIKDLLYDWRIGETWFWDCLCDADPANNTMNWQWVAGSGADASPFFRVFNPVMQGQKFDPDGAYVRRWVPELAKLEGKAIHEPWSASEAALEAAGIELGTTYPRPMLDHKKARDAALQAFRKIKA